MTALKFWCRLTGHRWGFHTLTFDEIEEQGFILLTLRPQLVRCIRCGARKP